MENLEEFKKIILKCGYYEDGQYVVELDLQKLKEIFNAQDIQLV